MVPPLEGLWWQENTQGLDYARKEDMHFISMIRLPDFVTKKDFEWAVQEATKKKKQDFSKVEFFPYDEGLCVQCMHIGSYDDEPVTVDLMHDYMKANGYELDITDTRYHHEIYLSDPRMKAPNPMVTFFKTFDVTNLIRVSRKRSLKFNMLLDYCIGRAAVNVKEFYILPVGDKLIQYDTIAVNTIVENKEGEVSSCDLSYKAELNQFNEEYLKYTTQVAASCQDRDLSENSMVIGTSAIIDTELDGAVGMNSDIFNNPFLIWGRYKKKWFRYYLPLSFQFHHTQMDGAHAGRFLERLQDEINRLQ